MLREVQHGRGLCCTLRILLCSLSPAAWRFWEYWQYYRSLCRSPASQAIQLGTFSLHGFCWPLAASLVQIRTTRKCRQITAFLPMSLFAHKTEIAGRDLNPLVTHNERKRTYLCPCRLALRYRRLNLTKQRHNLLRAKPPLRHAIASPSRWQKNRQAKRTQY
jgi:hypothetical protein